MRGVRLVSLAGLLCLVLGCQVLPSAPQLADLSLRTGAAQQLWEKGQAALSAGDPDLAIAFYRQGLNVPDAPPATHLSLAAAYLEKDDKEAACRELAALLQKEPTHTGGRAYYAELLLQLGRDADAWVEFETLIAQLQEERHLDYRRLIHCHGRLVELALVRDDPFEEHLQRGIGLYWLAQGRALAGDPQGDFPAEGLLCKAAAELSLASGLRPQAARPAWYLHGTWAKLGQSAQAERYLRMTSEAPDVACLTSAEQRFLQLASQESLAPRKMR